MSSIFYEDPTTFAEPELLSDQLNTTFGYNCTVVRPNGDYEIHVTEAYLNYAKSQSSDPRGHTLREARRLAIAFGHPVWVRFHSDETPILP